MSRDQRMKTRVKTATVPKSKFNILGLTDDDLLLIFSRFTVENLLSFRLVCKRFRRLCDSLLIKEKCLRISMEKKNTRELIEFMPHICPNIESMIITGIRFNAESFNRILRPDFKKLKKLVLQSCGMRFEFNGDKSFLFEYIHIIGVNLPELEVLFIQNMSVRELSLKDALINLRSLRKLEISHTRLRGFCLKYLAKSCTSITLRGCNLDIVGFMALMDRQGYLLEELEYSEDGEIDDRYFDIVCSRCHNLKKFTFKADNDLVVDKAPELRKLNEFILCAKRIAIFNAKSDFSSLNYLYLDCDEVYARTMMNMCVRYNGLKYLFIFTNNVNNLEEAVESITSLKSLQSLTLLSKNGTVKSDFVIRLIEGTRSINQLKIAVISLNDCVKIFNALTGLGYPNKFDKLNIDIKLEKRTEVNKQKLSELPANVTLRFVKRWETDCWYYP